MCYLRLFGFLLLFKWSIGNAQNPEAYRIYDEAREVISFEEMIRGLAKYDVILFGEFHNNSINHWLQLRTAKALHEVKGKQLVLGAEMFERDNQEEIDSYLSDTVSSEKMSEKIRLWPNYSTDYRPLLEFAKQSELKFVATNVPRSYASLVAQFEKGLDSLANLTHEKVYFVKLPIEVELDTPGYEEMLEMMRDHAGDKAMNYVRAQALKDATMAESILANWKRRQVFLHFNGHYHSKEYGGIYWYLKKRKKRVKTAIISVYESDSDLPELPENYNGTQYNMVFPADMIKTY